MEAAAAPTWDEDDQRPTERWLPTERDWPQPSLEMSLRAPAIPRELIDTASPRRPESQRSRMPLESGIREISRPRHQPRARGRR
jgi:hypothetical protein